jgi:hypothetical protein
MKNKHTIVPVESPRTLAAIYDEGVAAYERLTGKRYNDRLRETNLESLQRYYD